MRFSNLITLALTGLVAADLATIQGEFTKIQAAVTNLDNSINGLTSSTDPTTAINTLVSQSNAVTDALNSGTTTVSATDDLSLTDSITLLSSSNSLVSAVNTTVTDLENKKSIVDAANADGTVVTQLQQQKTASQAFIAAVVSKVPSAAQSIANNQAQAVVTDLNNGIVFFGGSASKRAARALRV
ncbi:hypothetical protein BT63DRAFT_417082 [Microthyrium microscopicum]|uniref:Hydrophobic surface binding protein A n=1 Tax=Microthyrium microscopicum TaxID=703497 RepID=A0A6A6TZP8_9PEZI|nr:hypothetical protein BT63DRAFT_417082 [Microthyrium microscopicum]